MSCARNVGGLSAESLEKELISLECKFFDKNIVLKLIDYLHDVLRYARITLQGNFPVDRYAVNMRGKVNEELHWFCVILVTGDNDLAQTFKEDFENWSKIMGMLEVTKK